MPSRNPCIKRIYPPAETWKVLGTQIPQRLLAFQFAGICTTLKFQHQALKSGPDYCGQVACMNELHSYCRACHSGDVLKASGLFPADIVQDSVSDPRQLGPCSRCEKPCSYHVIFDLRFWCDASYHSPCSSLSRSRKSRQLCMSYGWASEHNTLLMAMAALFGWRVGRMLRV